MSQADHVRWGIIGTAGIARSAFLPAVRATGGAVVAVGGRDLARTQAYAAENGIDRAIEGYQDLIEDPAVEAVYIPLPNGLHAPWTIRALRAGKPVLCEKPLCGTLAETAAVLEVAREAGTPLWEALVFPFHSQLQRIRGLIAEGVIGELAEIQSTFQVLMDRPGDIRLSRDLAGGAARDLACYPVRLARELLRADHESAWATARVGGDGVDVELQGSLGFSGGRTLMLSCGFGRSFDTFARLLGTRGQIHVSNPFLPRRPDYFEVFTASGSARYPATETDLAFAPAVGHIQAVVRGEQAPRLLAVDTALGTARALHDLLESAAAGLAGPVPG
jgi:predicted dehydrogenase